MKYICNREFSLIHNCREMIVHVGDEFQVVGRDMEHTYFCPAGSPWSSYVVRTEFFENHFRAQEEMKKMTGNEYQYLAMRTNDGKASTRLWNVIADANVSREYDIGGILNGCLGLSGEVGEFSDMVKKWIFREKELDVEHAKRECSGILWYVAMACESFGWNMDEIMQISIDKLKARYPEGFSVERSEHRAVGDD